MFTRSIVFAMLLISLASTSFAQRLIQGETLGRQVANTTVYYADGSREYFLPNGSSYMWAQGQVAYHRWSVQGNTLCFDGYSRECVVMVQNADNSLQFENNLGAVRLLGIVRGDRDSLVRRYGLGLRQAIDNGQLRLARRAESSVDLETQPRSYRAFDGEAPTARDGTVGRFVVRPTGRPSIFPHARFDEPEQPQLTASASVAPPVPSVTVTPQATQKSYPRVLFSQKVDRDPGCYVHRRQCLRRCDANSPEFSLLRQTAYQCREGCLDTYICAE